MDGGSTIEIDQRFHISLFKQWYACSVQLSSYGSTWQVAKHEPIARNQGHFEPANNYQRYIVLHPGTVEYEENLIWWRSRLDL